MVVSEVVRAWQSEPEYEVNAFFASDRPPVAVDELPEYQRLLEVSRRDLLQAVEGLDPEAMQRLIPGERWPLGGIVDHVARSELWYLDRLGPGFLRDDPRPDTLEHIHKVRDKLAEPLAGLDDRGARTPIKPGERSAHQVLFHTSSVDQQAYGPRL